MGGVFYNSGYIECTGAINNQEQGRNVGTIDVTLGWGVTSLGSLGNVICMETTEGYIYADKKQKAAYIPTTLTPA